MAGEITSLTYPQGLSYYDGERRERTSTVLDVSDVQDSYIFNYVPTFLFNGTSHSSEADAQEMTVMSLANGVTLTAKIWYNPGASTGSNWYIQGKYVFKDKAGNNINAKFKDAFGSETWNSAFAFNCNKDIYPNLSDIRINAYPQANYDLDGSTGVHADYFNVFGWTVKVPTASPYDAPALSGEVDRTLFLRYYDYAGNMALTDEEHYQEFLKVLRENGDDTPITPIDPWEDPSKPEIPDPDDDPFSDPVDFPDLPTDGDSLSTGFIRVYNPNTTQLQALAGELWTDNFFDTIKKIFNDPMEAVISLHSMPFNLPTGSPVKCKIGNYTSDVYMAPVTSQFVTRNLGSLTVPEHWASALDYAPYVQVDIFLPYIGIRSLQVDDIIGKRLIVEYNIDILSGACMAMIKCGDSVLYAYNTSIMFTHPINQSSFAPLYQSIVGAMGNVLSGYGSAGAGGAAVAAAGSAINVALSKQHSISRGGAIGGSTGALGGFTPYLIIHRPKQSLAAGLKHFKGYPSNITANVGSVTGYSEVESIHLTGVTCTETERDEIQALLYNGVIL